MTTIGIGTRVEAGEGEDHDTGRVVSQWIADVEERLRMGSSGGVAGDVLVAWDTGVRTWCAPASLEVQS